MITSKIIADSISMSGKRIVTFELNYQRFIHGEVMTHRVFSRNAMSSRAIPVQKMIDQVRNDPAMPVFWGKNQPGMQANEQLVGSELETAKKLWLLAANDAANVATRMESLGLHKQVANRILEPFQWMRTLVTATEFDNFFELRAHPDAQPEFQVLAYAMKEAMQNSAPIIRAETWHLPYVTIEERHGLGIEKALKVSVARCARVSYLTHGGEVPRYEDDVKLFERLVGSKPWHASPTEHQAYPFQNPTQTSLNFKGWQQYRDVL